MDKQSARKPIASVGGFVSHAPGRPAVRPRAESGDPRPARSSYRRMETLILRRALRLSTIRDGNGLAASRDCCGGRLIR